jgi:hypothetical protein
MNKQSVAGEQLAVLKTKLEKAISSRATLEKDFSYQSNLLIKFIDKLSHVSKGIDLELDNRLAKLRVLLTKSAPIADIEQHIGVISKQLLQHAKNNEHNILLMHVQFHNAGTTLQQVKGLPDNLRRELRALLTKNKDTKQALIQYVEIFSKLLTYYDSALKAKTDLPKTGLLNQASPVTDTLQAKIANNDTVSKTANKKVIEQFTKILQGLILSEKQTKKLNAIKKQVSTDISNENLLKSFLVTFNVIIEDFHQERKIAEIFYQPYVKHLPR